MTSYRWEGDEARLITGVVVYEVYWNVGQTRLQKVEVRCSNGKTEAIMNDTSLLLCYTKQRAGLGMKTRDDNDITKL